MKKSRANEPGGIWVLEEATGLLRALPSRSWILFLLGTLPFTWLAIDFTLQMSRSAFGAEQLPAYSLLLALLYLVKHTAQALFARECLCLLRGEPLSLPSAAPLLRLALVQSFFQPLRPLVLPVASIAIIPFPWAVAFLRNVPLSAAAAPRGFVRDAWRLARSDTRAHSVALTILFLAGLLLFVNLLALWFVVPMLLRSFFGLQTEFARLAGNLLNTTTFTVTAILTFAALEPASAALAAVRSFYAGARAGGDDLRGALRRLAAGLVLVAVLTAGAAPAQPPVDPQRLNQSIDDVLREPEFAWKVPKNEPAGDASWLRDLFQSIGRFFEWLLDLYKKIFGPDPTAANPGDANWSVNPVLLRWAMIAAGLLAAACLVWLYLSRRRSAPEADAPAPAAAVPPIDIADENLSAAQLVEDEWLRLADELAGRGDFRFAMRAVHLAGLRYLGEKGWITLQPAKTGREYGRELARRLRDIPAALDGYGRGLRQYEGVWYGFGTAGPDTYRALRAEWEDMRRHA